MDSLTEIFRDESYHAIREAQAARPNMDTKKQVDADGHAAGVAGKKMDVNPYGEADELHWIWLRGWTAARLEKHQSTTKKQ